MRVPEYDSNVRPTALPQVAVSVPNMPDTAGRQAQELGQGLMQTGNALARVAYDAAQQANQLRVDDALNQVKEMSLRLTYDKDGGFTSLKGINALQRPDGNPLEEEYGGKLKQHIDQVSGALGNDAQRQLFALHTNDILTAFKGHAIQHEAGEFKTYALSTSEGIQATALRDIGLNWSNPDAVNSAVDRIKAETYRQGQLLGKSAEWQEAQARKLTSNAHKVALLSALEQNDPAYADAYLKKYSGQMDADDILAVRGYITKEMDNRTGMAVAAEVMGKAQPSIQVGETERAFNIAVGTESNGKQFDGAGKPLTSSKGAIGIAQIMPDTGPEAAKLAGVPWDEHRYRNDAAYNKALGMAYFQKQLQVNGGDLAKAYAAYNAGPGALQEAIKKADKSAALAKTDPKVQVHGWIDFMPPETRNYVAKNLREFDAGQGQPQRVSFEEIDNTLRNDPRLANNPARYKAAREEAKRRYEEHTAAIKLQGDEAVAVAMRGVLENGGHYTDLPVSIRAAIPPKEVDTVINFAQKVSKGDDTTSPWLYNKLTSSPGALANMSDDQFFALRRELSEADFKHFSNERAKLTGKAPGGNGPGDLNSPAIKQVLDERLRMLKIDPNPKDDGGSDAARTGGIRKFVNDYFLTAQREAGKKFTDAEVTQHLDALFAKNVTLRGWLSNSAGPMLTMKVGDIPKTDKEAIKDAYKKQGVDDPTDAQILDIYWKRQLVRK